MSTQDNNINKYCDIEENIVLLSRFTRIGQGKDKIQTSHINYDVVIDVTN